MQIQQKEQLRKVLKFAILCSEQKVEEAQRLLSQLRNQSYYSPLLRLLKSIPKISQLQSTIRGFKLTIYDQEVTISHLNKQIVDLRIKKVEHKPKQHQAMLQIFGLLELSELSQAKKLADEANKFQISELIQDVMEYRYFKSKISTQLTPQASQQTIKLSKEGNNLQKFVKENTYFRKEINDHLVDEIRQYLKEGKTGQMPLPQTYFTEQFSKMYELLISKFRDIKNQLKDQQQNLKTKIGDLSKKLSLGLKGSQNFSDYFDNFLASIESEFTRLEEQAKVPQSYNRSSVSEMQSQNESLVSSIENLVRSSRAFKKTQNVFQTKTSKIKNRASINKETILKSQAYNQQVIEPKINILMNIVTQDPDEISNLLSISMTERLQKMTAKLQTIMQQSRKLKEENGIFLSTFFVSRLLDKQAEATNINTKLLTRQPSNSSQQYQATIRGLKQQLLRYKEEKGKLQTFVKLNKKREENRSFIHQSLTFTKCAETVEDLNHKIKISHEEIQRLHTELQSKNTIINELQLKNKKYVKALEEERQSFQKLQKRFNKLKEDFNDQSEEIAKLNNLYQERFIIETQERNSRLTQSAYERMIEEKEELANKNINLSAENEKLKNKIQTKKETNQIGAGSQVLEPEDDLFSNGSFIDSIPNVSRIMERSFTPNVEVDIKAYEDKINSLQKTIELMTNQQQQRQMNDQSLLLAHVKQVQRLMQVVTELQKENERLRHQIDTANIRRITHNEENIKNLHLFPPGFIFDQYDYEERLYLLENLLSEVGPIKATRLLYRADVHNRTNFHNYVDNHRHIVFVIKTVYGKLIAGYSQQAFNPREIRKGRGIILSLWAKKAFYVGDRKAITYDDYYLIFGNSELRIRSQQFKLFSNFGIANAYYDNKGEKVGTILGEDNQREVDLMEYEVYALDLEQ